MFKNNNNELNEINLKSIREIKAFNLNFFDFIVFGLFCLPVILLLFIYGMNTTLIIISLIYLGLSAIWCFARIRKQKVRWIITRWLVWNLFKKKIHHANECKIYCRIDKREDNHFHFITKTQTGYISFYRLNGNDLSLVDEANREAIISSLADFWGNKNDFDIVSVGIQYQSKHKRFNLLNPNEQVKQLEKQYNAYIDEINETIAAKQQTYFLVIRSDSIETNKEKYEMLSDFLSLAKIEALIPTENELSQLINEFYGYKELSNTFGFNIKEIHEYYKGMKITYTNNEVDYVSFRTIKAVGDVVNEGYLNNVFNNPDYTVYMNTRYLPNEVVKNIFYKTQNALFQLVNSKWFNKRATDIQRDEIELVKSQVDEIQDTLTANKEVYEMREVLMIVMFKGKSIKEVDAKIRDFDSYIENHEKAVVVDNLGSYQFEAFLWSRIFPLNELTHKLSWTEKVKQLFMVTKSKVNTIPTSFCINNALTLLNSSLALGYIFNEKVSIGDQSSWYKGIVSTRGNHLKPLFVNLWTINDNIKSFSRIYLAQTGKGKTWTVKRDLLQDYFDGNYIISIDPKPDYTKMCELVGGSNITLGNQKTNNKQSLNVFDILITPSDINKSNDEILNKTYAKNDVIINTLLSLDDNTIENKLIMSAWSSVEKYVYEDVLKFHTCKDITKATKKAMPLMDDFISGISKLMNKDKDNKALKLLYAMLYKFHSSQTYGYLFNSHSNIDWTTNSWFNIDISAISNLDRHIFAAFIAYLMYLSIDIMVGNKSSRRRFNLYIDEFHTIRDIPCVLRSISKFVKICRSHNGSASIVDLGLGIVSGDADRLYREIFEQIQYGYYFGASDNDIKKLQNMLEQTGNPLSQLEMRFLERAKSGECLLIVNTFNREQLTNDMKHWLDFFNETRSEGIINAPRN